MKTTTLLLLALASSLSAHTSSEYTSSLAAASPPTETRETTEPNGFVRINSTIQNFNAGQPWQRNNPVRRRGLGALLSPNEILTVAEMVADQTYLEFESSDGTNSVTAEVVAIDYKANLALLTPTDPDRAAFLNELTPLPLGEPANIGDTANIWQFDGNGTPLKTEGTIRTVDTFSSFIAGYAFLAYEIKGSMQSASSSFTLPVTRNGKLLGVLTSYDSEDQLSRVIAPEIIAKFIADARDHHYEGFPSLGVATQATEDKIFRQYLSLTNNQGGLYISTVKPRSAAEKAGLQRGDVLLSVNDKLIDRRGYFDHPSYGPLPWTVLIRGVHSAGDEIKLEVLREGSTKTILATLESPEPALVPRHIYDSPPPFLINGGLVFQELSRSYLTAFGENWDTRAPIALMHVLENPEDYEEGRNSVVFLARVIPNPATVGYDRLSGILVESINGKPVPDLATLAAELETPPANGIHAIGLADSPHTIYLNARFAAMVDQQLLQSGLPTLSRLPKK
ncbi:MAG: PDZ domain-containing protein [Verrucomicrobiota bacterium]